MEELEVYIHHVMLCEFQNNKNPAEIPKKISSIY